MWQIWRGDKLAIIEHILSALTSIASLAVDAFFGSAANSPIPIHKEAVT